MADKEYTTEAKVETYLNESISNGDVAAIILAIQDFIDDYTGRNFKADTDASARIFNGLGGQLLSIDDCVQITKVEQGQGFYDTSGFSTIGSTGSDRYIPLPNNYSEKNLPINQLILQSRVWTTGIKNHRITAKWGYSAAVPDDISQAATILVAGLYKKGRGGGEGNVKSEKIGNFSISYKDLKGLPGLDNAINLIEGYKKLEI